MASAFPRPRPCSHCIGSGFLLAVSRKVAYEMKAMRILNRPAQIEIGSVSALAPTWRLCPACAGTGMRRRLPSVAIEMSPRDPVPLPATSTTAASSGFATLEID